jgi:hypothetical protein
VTLVRAVGGDYTMNSVKELPNNIVFSFLNIWIERNARIFPQNDRRVEINLQKIIRKYTQWIIQSGNNSDIEEIVGFFNGNRISIRKLISLIKKSNRSLVVAPTTMRDFFEHALFAAAYNKSYVLLYSIILTIFGNRGLFYLRVCGKKFFS